MSIAGRRKLRQWLNSHDWMLIVAVSAVAFIVGWFLAELTKG